MTEPIEVFLSYSHKDDELRQELSSHLSILTHLIKPWDDRAIDAGAEWAQEIAQNLERAEIILLLVSANFMNSDYCYGVEMEKALKRHQSQTAQVIPIIIRTCNWQKSPLGQLQAIPIDNRSVASYLNPFERDDCWFQVIQKVEKAAEQIKNHKIETMDVFSADLGSGVFLEMVKIPGGSFLMGSPDGQGDDEEHPQHLVTVPEFFMGKYPVTQAQWRSIAALPSVAITLELEPSGFKGADRPVENVTWYQAVEFCQRLSRLTSGEYRLPSESEWEYACRANTVTQFYFGDTLEANFANFRETVGQTTAVGSYPPNAFDLYDMHGNVLEWCQDNWHTGYQGAPTDGSAWIDSGASRRMVRGGCWDLNPRYCRSADRSYPNPDFQYDFLGFRVVCEAAKTL
jgi:formylglycine-generating enzyme required for sulfatase activity